jgi:hypothetical protein
VSGSPQSFLPDLARITENQRKSLCFISTSWRYHLFTVAWAMLKWFLCWRHVRHEHTSLLVINICYWSLVRTWHFVQETFFFVTDFCILLYFLVLCFICWHFRIYIVQFCFRYFLPQAASSFTCCRSQGKKESMSSLADWKFHIFYDMHAWFCSVFLW